MQGNNFVFFCMCIPVYSVAQGNYKYYEVGVRTGADTGVRTTFLEIMRIIF